ncbi:MAG: DUF5680 domain-containing protein [Patescibacteria group bacterium]
MLDLKQLKDFLAKAKKAGYASGETAVKAVEEDKSKTIVFEEGDFKYHDNYFGGEPYGGREVVFFKGEPVYLMVYYGLVKEDISDFKAVYRILQKSLSLIPADYPYRGPKEFSEGDYRYQNDFMGEINDFSGEELIEFQGREIYRAKYIGGLVDQRKEE